MRVDYDKLMQCNVVDRYISYDSFGLLRNINSTGNSLSKKKKKKKGLLTVSSNHGKEATEPQKPLEPEI